jgi:hypothetical protein
LTVSAGSSCKSSLNKFSCSFTSWYSILFFVRALKWVWFGTVTAESEKQPISINKEVEQQTKNSIEYHDVKEQENLFRLDLQDEPAETVKEEGQQENKVL